MCLPDGQPLRPASHINHLLEVATPHPGSVELDICLLCDMLTYLGIGVFTNPGIIPFLQNFPWSSHRQIYIELRFRKCQCILDLSSHHALRGRGLQNILWLDPSQEASKGQTTWLQWGLAVTLPLPVLSGIQIRIMVGEKRGLYMLKQMLCQ